MAENSKIEWTDHTWNPWWGCVKVSEACAHCYAETLANRFKAGLWGPNSERRFFGDTHWNEPLKWHKKASRERVRRKVFCASMADVFENRDDLTSHRARLFALIEETEMLDWLLLTKRPENVRDMVPAHWLDFWPEWAWIGTTVENQQRANERVPHLLQIPASVRFLSIEPMLGPIDLFDVDGKIAQAMSDMNPRETSFPAERIDWVICGGESGPKARPMDLGWVRSLRDQCVESGTPFFFKQWGEFAPYYEAVDPEKRITYMREIGKGMVSRVGKKAAGCLLDGREWKEFPVIR